MKLRTLFLLILLVAIGAFAAMNWNTFITPTTLSLGFTTVLAPLGVIMLGLLALVVASFLVFALTMQASVLMETRRHAREMQANRELADRAEASRFTELRSFLETEMQRQSLVEAEARAGLLVRIEQLDRDLRHALEESGNVMTAHMGQLEDRLDMEAHVLRPRPS